MLISVVPDQSAPRVPHFGMSRSPVLRSGRKYMQTDLRIFTDWDDPFGGSANGMLVTYWFLKFSREGGGFAPGLLRDPRIGLRK